MEGGEDCGGGGVENVLCWIGRMLAMGRGGVRLLDGDSGGLPDMIGLL